MHHIDEIKLHCNLRKFPCSRQTVVNCVNILTHIDKTCSEFHVAFTTPHLELDTDLNVFGGNSYETNCKHMTTY